jgi:hypothetical protein
MVGAPGTEYVGALPGFLNDPCPSSIALMSASKEPEAARDNQINVVAGSGAALAQDARRAGDCKALRGLRSMAACRNDAIKCIR